MTKFNYDPKLFETSQEELGNVLDLISKMRANKNIFDSNFIIDIINGSKMNFGMAELIKLYFNAKTLEEQYEILQDIIECLYDLGINDEDTYKKRSSKYALNEMIRYSEEIGLYNE